MELTPTRYVHIQVIIILLTSSWLQGAVLPFQHRAVQELITSVLFVNSKSLGARFPRSFGPKIPIPVILLACCAVSSTSLGILFTLTRLSQLRCALEEFQDGFYSSVEFSVDGFRSVYDDLNDKNIQMMKPDDKFAFDQLRGSMFRQARYAKSFMIIH